MARQNPVADGLFSPQVPRPGFSLAWKLVLTGVAAGIVGGGLGVGGGIVMVPLLLLAGFDRHRAHGTSLAAIVLIAAAGATSFGVDGELVLGLGLTIGLGGIVGSSLGAAAMHRMSPRALSIIFGLVLLIAAARMIGGGDPLPGSAEIGGLAQTAIVLGIGLLAGLFAGVAGVGGGIVIVPSTVLFLGLTQHEAQGTSLLAIVLTAMAGTVVNRRNQRVRLGDGLVVGIGGVVGSVIGSRIALGVEGESLSLVFGLFVLLVGIRTLYRAWRSPQTVSSST
jgi:hypothetical protein